MELSNQLPGSHPLTAPIHPPERVTGPPELHHSEGRYLNAFAQIADLSFFAVQTRYDDTVEISSPDWPLLLGITVSLLEQVQGDLT